MNLQLIRLNEIHSPTPEVGATPGISATPGVLVIPDGGPALYTIERPWMQNTQRVSCVPHGTYDLKRRFCDDDPSRETFYLISWCVSDEDEGLSRWGVRFDVANYAHQVMGCIAIGTGFSRNTDKGCMVTGSGDANADLLERLDVGRSLHTLTVRNA